MQLAEFDFDLPDDLIAKYPASDRRASRLLVVDARANGAGRFDDRRFAELPALLDDDDLLVFNDTRVIKARLGGRKASGGRVEVLVERLLGDHTMTAHVRASKSPAPGSLLHLDGDCDARVIGRSGELFELELSRPVKAQLETHGGVPLPPYLGRAAEADDETRYQTVYARHPGAVAAPTAGLHFDEAMLEETRAAGVRHAFVTLHVGAGTFQSLRTERVEDNRLHRERVVVGEDVAGAIAGTRARGGRVIAVGTTVVRALEAASASGECVPFEGETDLFITPGYAFRQVDAMLTNFHLPKSSLLILVSAFAGIDCMRCAYRHAVAARYRFFSYGDSMLIWPRAGRS